MSMVETLDELSYDFEDDGVLVRKQLDRLILARGAWATVMFLYQELDRGSGTFRAPKLAVVRFKKASGAYRKHSSFNVAGAAEARRLADVFAAWATKMEALSSDADEAQDEPQDDDDGERERDAGNDAGDGLAHARAED